MSERSTLPYSSSCLNSVEKPSLSISEVIGPLPDIT